MSSFKERCEAAGFQLIGKDDDPDKSTNYIMGGDVLIIIRYTTSPIYYGWAWWTLAPVEVSSKRVVHEKSLDDAREQALAYAISIKKAQEEARVAAEFEARYAEAKRKAEEIEYKKVHQFIKSIGVMCYMVSHWEINGRGLRVVVTRDENKLFWKSGLSPNCTQHRGTVDELISFCVTQAEANDSTSTVVCHAEICQRLREGLGGIEFSYQVTDNTGSYFARGFRYVPAQDGVQFSYIETGDGGPTPGTLNEFIDLVKGEKTPEPTWRPGGYTGGKYVGAEMPKNCTGLRDQRTRIAFLHKHGHIFEGLFPVAREGDRCVDTVNKDQYLWSDILKWIPVRELL